MRQSKYVQHALLGTTAVLIASAQLLPDANRQGPVLRKALTLAMAGPANGDSASSDSGLAGDGLATSTRVALGALASRVRTLSHPDALRDAFRSYFAYQTEHPEEVKPYLYFVDYGLPSTEPRGYVFDMRKLAIVEGPFTVAHGRGSASSHYGAPTYFSNDPGSQATSLGLYVAEELYRFSGRASGRAYSSLGLRISGVSSGFNDNARARKVVVHGAPYVTPRKAGLSEGCPAMEPARARRLLPKLAGGGLIFLFAPDEGWLSRDPWLAANPA